MGFENNYSHQYRHEDGKFGEDINIWKFNRKQAAYLQLQPEDTEISENQPLLPQRQILSPKYDIKIKTNMKLQQKFLFVGHLLCYMHRKFLNWKALY